jgi:isopenicillin-N epimerase
MVFLNHGSFGSCPWRVLEHQQEVRTRLEGRPVHFFVRELEGLLDGAREMLARFVGANPGDLVFVPNATSGVNTVLRSLRFKAKDELLVTDHEYNACRNALNFAAERAGARIVVAHIPFPLRSEATILDAILERVTARTRLALLDHVTSPTGLVLPLAPLVRVLQARGVDTLIDGAHAPGMVPLNLRRLGATYYTGNCHKWLCAPKGAGFLVVQRDRQTAIRPLSISHGANSPRQDRSRYLIEFGWTGTWDPSAYLSVPVALDYMAKRLPGGWPEIMRHNRELALAGRRTLCKALHIDRPCPDTLIGALASVPIDDAPSDRPPLSPLYTDELQDRLWTEHRIEVPIMPWPKPPKRLLRISAQLYNATPEYRWLADRLRELLPRKR